MANKSITLTMTHGNNQIIITDVLSGESPWTAQAYLFHKFLLAQGYYMDGDQVGADVGVYVDAEVPEEF